jgi:hypothetical protein
MPSTQASDRNASVSFTRPLPSVSPQGQPGAQTTSRPSPRATGLPHPGRVTHGVAFPTMLGGTCRPATNRRGATG